MSAFLWIARRAPQRGRG